MASFDAASLFTNIPLKESIDLAVSCITEGNTKLKFSRTEFVKTLCIATSQTNCLFNGKVFDQIDGVAMGSPLAPFLANLFVGHHQNLWMKNYQGPAVLSIDDMLMIHSVFSTLRMRQNYFLTFLTHNIQISNSLWKKQQDFSIP